MSLLIVGLNHETAPIAVRERVSFAPEQLSEGLIITRITATDLNRRLKMRHRLCKLLARLIGGDEKPLLLHICRRIPDDLFQDGQ